MGKKKSYSTLLWTEHSAASNTDDTAYLWTGNYIHDIQLCKKGMILFY